MNRGDIKLAIDMVVNAQDDKLFGGEAEYVINTLEDCGNEIARLTKQRDDLLAFAQEVANTSSSSRLRRLANNALASVKEKQ